MSNTVIHTEVGARVERAEDGTHFIAVRADKIANRHGYGFTRENGNVTRSYARLVARKVLTPLDGGVPPQVSPAVDAYMVGTDLWRTYRVEGA